MEAIKRMLACRLALLAAASQAPLNVRTGSERFSVPAAFCRTNQHFQKAVLFPVSKGNSKKLVR